MSNKEGKLKNQLLRKMLKHLPMFRDDIMMRPAIGEDCAAFKVGDQAVVMTTDPITAADSNHGELVVRVCLNDLASSGVSGTAMLLTILAPVSATDDEIEKIFIDAGRTAKESGVEIIGGHTERTNAVNKMIVSATAVGVLPITRLKSSSGAKPGDLIYLTKVAAVEGSMILATESGEPIANTFASMLSAERDGAMAASKGATALHDVTEGGVLGAIHEMCEASSVGCKINISAIPIHPYTKAICAKKGIDPLRLIGSGSMLISIHSQDALLLEEAFKKAGILLSKIGHTTEDKTKIRIDAGKETEILPPSEDHLFNTKMK